MKQIRSVLTLEEEQKPYSKYFHYPIAAPNQELIELLQKGPMDAEKALMPENINDLLTLGYHEVETGYCVLPNGTAYVAVNNKFPGVTPDMINWWFAWHGLEDMRYMLWFNKGHFGISVSELDRQIILDPKTPMVEKFQGRTHFVIEDTGGGPEDIIINFLKPEDMGFDLTRINNQNFAAFVGGNGVSQLRSGGPKSPAIMCHFVRNIPGGVEFRTRFWLGYHMVDKKPVKLLPEGIQIPVQVPMGLAFHNVMEYSNLAAILPSLYNEQKGEIK